MQKSYLLGLILVGASLLCGCTGEPGSTLPVATEYKGKPDKDAKGVRSRAFKYVMSKQNEDGSYGSASWSAPMVGKTALVTYVLISTERGYRETDGPFVSKAVDFILAGQNEDGSFGKSSHKIFETTLALKVLSILKNPAYAQAQEKGVAYMKTRCNLADFSADSINQDLASFRLAWEAADAMNGVVPGTYAKLLMDEALPNISRGVGLVKDAEGKETDWMKNIFGSLQSLQNNDGNSLEYGEIRAPYGGTVEGDPVVSTALAAKLCDLIKDNYKKLTAAKK
jgi:hypothetical protein